MLHAFAGKPMWKAAGVSDKIDMRVGPAADTLDELLKACFPLTCMHQCPASEASDAPCSPC